MDYLTDRKIQLEKNVIMKVASGVPQGSVLGPTLWNVLYNDVMNIKVPNGVELICYADDLAIPVTAKNTDKIVRNANKTLQGMNTWMRKNNLSIAPEKPSELYSIGEHKQTR